MNKIILMGRLTKDPEVKYTSTGKVVTSFTLAVDRPFASQDGKKEADFINCQIWGKSAEILGNSVKKGQRVLVEGRLQIRNYENKDKVKHWITEVVTERFEYIERKEGSNGNVVSSSNDGWSGMGTAVPFDEEISF